MELACEPTSKIAMPLRMRESAWIAVGLIATLGAAGCCLEPIQGEATVAGGGSSGASEGATSAGVSASTGGGNASTSGQTTGGNGSDFGGSTSGGNCNPQFMSAQFDPCTTPGSCGCPFDCVEDPVALWAPIVIGPLASDMVCERECRTNADCPSTWTGCVQGVCALVACGDSSNSPYYTTCSIGDQPSGGSCYIFLGLDAGTGAVCVQGGDAPADGGCDVYADLRSDLSQICPAGFECQGGIQLGYFACFQLCYGDQVECPPGDLCVTPVWWRPAGVCIPANPSAQLS